MNRTRYVDWLVASTSPEVFRHEPAARVRTWMEGDFDETLARRMESDAHAEGYRNACPVEGTTPDDYRLREVVLDGELGSDLGSEVGNVVGSGLGSDLGNEVGSKLGSGLGIELGIELGSELGSEPGREPSVLAGIHFLGLDLDRPFVGVYAQTRALGEDEFDAASRRLLREFAAFRPPSVWWWRPTDPQPDDAWTPDQRIWMGRIESLLTDPGSADRAKTEPSVESSPEQLSEHTSRSGRVFGPVPHPGRVFGPVTHPSRVFGPVTRSGHGPGRVARSGPVTVALASPDDLERIYPAYSEAYEALWQSDPRWRGRLQRSELSDLAACADAGGLGIAQIDGSGPGRAAGRVAGRVAGLIAALPGRVRGIPGWEMTEEILFPEFRGRGYARDMQRAFLGLLDRTTHPWVIGTIDTDNLASQRTAQSVGRKDAGGWSFHTPASE